MPPSRSALAQDIARSIIEAIAEGEIAEGQHLRAQRLADRFGVSRSPVRDALQLLSERGFAEQRANRGYFARAADPESERRPDGGLPFEQPNSYQRIADDWLANRIPPQVTEHVLRERYDLTKAQLGDILLRAVREGWVERKPGYGWRFLSVAKTPEAFEQIYRLRMALEPAAMLEPTFAPDRRVLSALRATQQKMLDSEIERLSGEKLLDNGATFHEEIIRFSGNPFFHQALVRANRLRRLMEYRSRIDRRRLYTQCAEHLEILDLLERGETEEASRLMRRHLHGALAQKSPACLQSAGEGGGTPLDPQGGDAVDRPRPRVLNW